MSIVAQSLGISTTGRYAYYGTWAARPSASLYPIGAPVFFTDIGAEYFTNGTDWLLSGSISAVTYGAYGPTSITADGITSTITYANGKVSTVVSGGQTKTYTWSGDELVSVVVS